MIENPILEYLKNKKIILASGSPRRKRFFEELGIPFEVRLKSVEEVYPKNLKAHEISDYLAELKAKALQSSLSENELLVTSDTVVWFKGESLAKANTVEEAKSILTKLSGAWHSVITSVCFTTAHNQKTVNATTEVKFKELTKNEIQFYIKNYQPFDKAGAYGIQEWLGAIAVEEIKGSYTNVMGLPTHLVYKTLTAMVS